MNKYQVEFLKYLKEIKHYSAHTVLNYKDDLMHFSFFVKDYNLNKITYNDIRKYLTYLYDKKYSKKTISRHISTLRSYFKYLCRENIIKNNPMTLISNPKEEKKLPNFLYYEEVENLLNVPDRTTPLGIRDAVTLELLYSTGIRVSELVNIKIKDIDFSDRRIIILGKGNKERYVIYGKYLEDLLELYLNNSRTKLKKVDTDILLLNKNGTPLTDRGVRLIINNVLKKGNLDYHVTPHTLRHTFATHMLDGGADLKIVQELLGHENLATTEIYTHISNERLRKVYLEAHPRSKMN